MKREALFNLISWLKDYYGEVKKAMEKIYIMI